MDQQPTFYNVDQAFAHAVELGRLSNDHNAPNYAGNYMYMGTYGTLDQFKNVKTREYDV